MKGNTSLNTPPTRFRVPRIHWSRVPLIRLTIGTGHVAAATNHSIVGDLEEVAIFALYPHDLCGRWCWVRDAPYPKGSASEAGPLVQRFRFGHGRQTQKDCSEREKLKRETQDQILNLKFGEMQQSSNMFGTRKKQQFFFTQIIHKPRRATVFSAVNLVRSSTLTLLIAHQYRGQSVDTRDKNGTGR